MKPDFISYSFLMLLGLCPATLFASGDDWLKTSTLSSKPDFQVKTPDATIMSASGTETRLKPQPPQRISETARSIGGRAERAPFSLIAGKNTETAEEL